jgi:RNA polymerase sigma factor (sigma-70 family)
MKGPAQPSAPNRAALITSYTFLAWHIAATFRHWSLELDDWRQLAMVAVTQAVDTFDPGRGVPLDKYVAIKIGFALGDQLQRASRVDRPHGGHTREAADPSTVGQLDDDDLGQLREALDGLPPRERRILIDLYGLGGRRPLTQSAVGAELGLCRYTILKSAKRSLSTLRATLTA